jgi:alpha-L-fucosidase
MPVPAWFSDAKLGIFVHWGLYSLPAYAPTVGGDLRRSIAARGFRAHFAENPYAEWYLNGLRIAGSSTAAYHRRCYGELPYEGLAPRFDAAAERWDPAAWAGLFAAVGARYVTVVAKHHDGFCLWPTTVPHPRLGRYAARRDVVGELASAVRARGLRLGLYYSTALDWSVQPEPIRDVVSFLTNGPTSPDYARLCDAQLVELVDRYAPSQLWADLGYPARGALDAVIAHYRARVPDGVINDRWAQPSPWLRRLLLAEPLGALSRRTTRAVADAVGRALLSRATLFSPPARHADFVTPEYATFPAVHAAPWEATRGLGGSFGYNREETAAHHLDGDGLVHLLLDVVAKGGNLLVNVGPTAEGDIPALQRAPLEALGRWLAVHGEAIFATRPDGDGVARTRCGREVRRTRRGDVRYLAVLGRPRGRDVTIPVDLRGDHAIEALGAGPVAARRDAAALTLAVPDGAGPAIVYRCTPRGASRGVARSTRTSHGVP